MGYHVAIKIDECIQRFLIIWENAYLNVKWKEDCNWVAGNDFSLQKSSKIVIVIVLVGGIMVDFSVHIFKIIPQEHIGFFVIGKEKIYF